MERSLIFLSLLTIMDSTVIKQYHYVSETLNWTQAQTYCRAHYYDLAYVDSLEDNLALQEAAGSSTSYGYFGLHRDINNITGWKWSGGGYVTYTHWRSGQPNTADETKNVGLVFSGGWNNLRESYLLHFYCMSLPTVEEEETSWEEAEEHCRETNTSLISLRSDTELLLLQRLMMQQGHDRIWIGLRFLAGRWLWVNADPLGFQAWSEEEQDLQCPLLKRCVALSAEGRWETLDCLEKLHFMCN